MGPGCKLLKKWVDPEMRWEYWHPPVVLAPRRLKQEDQQGQGQPGPHSNEQNLTDEEQELGRKKAQRRTATPGL